MVIYRSLAEAETRSLFMREWESYLQHTWSIEEWHRVSTAASKGILNIALIKANVKVLMRWYMVPLKPSKCYSNASPVYFRNCGHVGSMLHIWCDCPKIRGLWNKIFNVIRKITELPMQKSPHLALLNFPCPKTPKLVQRLIIFIFIGTKLTIARAWKRPTVSFLLVKRKKSWIMTQEKTVSILLDTTTKHDAVWDPWARYISLPPTTSPLPGPM